MEVDQFLVLWVKETPQRYSVMSRNDLMENSARSKSGKDLVGKEFEFKWKKNVCTGEIVSFGMFAIIPEINFNPMQIHNFQNYYYLSY